VIQRGRFWYACIPRHHQITSATEDVIEVEPAAPVEAEHRGRLPRCLGVSRRVAPVVDVLKCPINVPQVEQAAGRPSQPRRSTPPRAFRREPKCERNHVKQGGGPHRPDRECFSADTSPQFDAMACPEPRLANENASARSPAATAPAVC
jgi:hypothetical protein